MRPTPVSISLGSRLCVLWECSSTHSCAVGNTHRNMIVPTDRARTTKRMGRNEYKALQSDWPWWCPKGHRVRSTLSFFVFHQRDLLSIRFRCPVALSVQCRKNVITNNKDEWFCRQSAALMHKRFAAMIPFFFRRGSKSNSFLQESKVTIAFDPPLKIYF